MKRFQNILAAVDPQSEKRPAAQWAALCRDCAGGRPAADRG